MSTFDSNLLPSRLAVLSAYPACIAACVAFLLSEYASTKARCFSVRTPNSDGSSIISSRGEDMMKNDVFSFF